MYQESDSEEEELVVGKITERNKNVNNRLEDLASEGPFAKQMPQHGVKTHIGHHYGTQQTSVEERESENLGKENTDGLTVDCREKECLTKTLHGMEVRQSDKDENFSLKPPNLRHSRRRNTRLAGSSSRGDDTTDPPTNSKRRCVSSGKDQSASRIFLKNHGRNKTKRTKASKERESSEERELVVGGSFQGERWFDQLSCDQANGEGDSLVLAVTL